MNYVFLCEFEELRSPLRDTSSQGGGVHGNAILSRFDMSDARVIQHRCETATLVPLLMYTQFSTLEQTNKHFGSYDNRAS